MGTLDDAIREHLELKRRSGADDQEVSRLESEAFGPVRRDAPRPAPVEVEADSATSIMPAAPTEEPIVAEELPPPPAEPPVEVVAEQPLPDWMDDEEDAAPQSTAEFTAADVVEAAGAPPADYVAPDEEDAEDLLEETPDFLQETPEHDRLWFEQKPPRDFDFDS
ncbi:MAG: hypothetical protein QOF76_1595 [Solirubrobacteraceae bacterium]|jgi:hypothetical protein|nr:hypothetical protein [Solirubrobacteraceae bacterium]